MFFFYFGPAGLGRLLASDGPGEGRQMMMMMFNVSMIGLGRSPTKI